jgi:predicted amidohydrolase YtcJ
MARAQLLRRKWCVLLTSVAFSGSAPALAEPDYIIHNAKVVTVDKEFSIAQALAVEGDRFLKVGTNEEVLRIAGPRTQRIDMQGRTVLPGMTDSHQNLISRAESFDIAADLGAVTSIAQIQEALRARLATTKPGQWIIGTRGWWEYELTDKRTPTRADLDMVSTQHPIGIPGPHYWIFNSYALRQAKITRDTPDPPGGEIHKDAQGEPNGLMMDRASRLAMLSFPTANREEKKSGILKLIQRANSNGLTSVGETGGSLEDEALLKELHNEGRLTLRFDLGFSIDPTLPTEKLEQQLAALGPPGRTWGDGMFRADTLSETGLDGAEATGYLRHEYPGKPGYYGIRLVPGDNFTRFAVVANRFGWRLRPHAVGDAAIDQALTAYEAADADRPISHRRWMIDHAFLVRPDHYPRIKKLGMMINSQYMHNYQLGELILKAWGREMADQSEPYADWMANGIMFANGSDGPVSYYSEPLLMIYGVVTRKTDWGGSLGPMQGISREDAIRSVTSNSAHTTFEEQVKGSIEAGKFADFVVLSDDILTVPADRIKDIKVLTTVLAGRPIYGSVIPASAAPARQRGRLAQ